MESHPTTRAAGLKDVAALAGVSVSTVSRVMRGDLGLVGEETAERVRAAAAELRYHPSAAARALARGRTQTVAVAYQYPHLSHYEPMLAAARKAIETHRYRMLHLAIESDGGIYPSMVLAERRADVLVLAGVNGAHEALEWIAEPHQQVVAAGAFSPADKPPILTAYWDDHEGIMAAVAHLADLGHQRIAYLGGLAGPKFDIFEECAAARGLDYTLVRSDVGTVSDWMADGADMARQASARSPRPTALFARNDYIALGALSALGELGLRVPADISVIGYFDTPLASFCQPPLTSVSTPFTECVTEVIERALTTEASRSSASSEASFVRHPTRLVTRNSAGHPD